MLKRIVLYLSAALMGIIAAVALSVVFSVTTVMGSGMEPYIDDGSKVLINKVAYRNIKPRVGDIIAFSSDVYSEEGEGTVLIRRVAGSAGDVVEIKDNIFYLNGRPYEKYMAEPVNMAPIEKIKLHENEIFVLSDNRKSSMDSRNMAIGVINSKECIGKVCFK